MRPFDVIRKYRLSFAAVALFATLVALPLLLRRQPPPPAPTHPSIPAQPDPDPQVVRAERWKKVLPRLDEADRLAAAVIDGGLTPVEDFFAERRSRTRAVGEQVLSLRGKWAYIHSKLPGTDPEGHIQFLREQFETHVFSPAELQGCIESALAGCLSRVQAIEDRLLVQILADVRDPEPPTAQAVPALRSEEILRQQYGRLAEQLLPVIAADLAADVVLLLRHRLPKDVVARLAVRVATALATRLGVSAALLGVGTSSSWVTLGAGFVVSVILDLTVDWLLQLAGHDPAGQVAEQITQTLNRLKRALLVGDPEATAVYAKLRLMEANDPVEEVRHECKKAADSIARRGILGLRHELNAWHKVRAHLRREALKKLILEGVSS